MAAYLDYNATTPVDPRVVEAMLPYLSGPAGNPSSAHRFGRAARAALEQARGEVAALVGAQPGQVIFTSGGTEANNLAIRGVMELVPDLGQPHAGGVAVSAVEHASVLAPAARLAGRGVPLTRIPADSEGCIQPQAVDAALARHPALVSVMWVNNETGVIQPVAEIAARVRAAGTCLHTDAVQAAGKVPVDFFASGAHLLSLSAHKIYGPKGVGALVVDPAVDLAPLIEGGGQERGLRGGTENVAGIVGFGVAASLAVRELEGQSNRLRRLRDGLERALAARAGVTIFGAGAQRVPNTVQFAAPGIAGETLVLELDRRGVAVSSGSACGSERPEPSHVLAAMGVPRDLAYGALRVSLGQGTTQGDLDALLQALDAVCAGHAPPVPAVP